MHSITIVADPLKKATGQTAKLKLVIYKTGYSRAIRSLRYSVELNEWDKNKERSKKSGTIAVALNSFLDGTTKKLSDQILLWETSGIDWDPKQLVSILDSKSDKPRQTKAVTVVAFIDRQIHFF